MVIKVNGIIEPDWGAHLKTKESFSSYLSRRVEDLAIELKEQPTRLEKTKVAERFVWIAKLIYHTLCTIVFLIGKLIAKIGKSKKLSHNCKIHFFNHGTKLYSRAKALLSPKELLVKSHNGFNLNRSNVAFRRDLQYNSTPLDMSSISGNCFGICYLFSLLYIEGKQKFPDLSDRELLIKISHLMRDGALPESSIVQLLDPDDVREHLSNFLPEAGELFKIRPESRQLDRIDILKSEIKGKNPVGIDKLKEVRVGVPYLLITRTGITGNTHSTLLIRTGNKAFYWFDSCRGLTSFEGDKGMKKLLRLWEYGTQQKHEKEDLIRAQKALVRLIDDFVKRHNLNDHEKQLLKKVEEYAKAGKPWNKIVELKSVKEQKNLVRHFFDTFLEGANRKEAAVYDQGLISGVLLTPFLHGIIGKYPSHDQKVRCYYWKEDRKEEEELLKCTVRAD